MHFPKLCNIFRHKAAVIEPTKPNDSVAADVVQHNNDVDEDHVQEKSLPATPTTEGSPIGPSDVLNDPMACQAHHPTFTPFFWPNIDRAPSMMHFYVPSRSLAAGSKKDKRQSSIAIPEGLFQDFSGTFESSESSSNTSTQRPGAVSRLDYHPSNETLRRDSLLHGSITIQCHPAILDTPTPFKHHSSPDSLERRPRHTPSHTALLRRVSILEIQSDLLLRNLESQTQNLSDTTQTLQVTRQMLMKCNDYRLQIEDAAKAWSAKYHHLLTGLESLLRANNAMEQDLHALRALHATCPTRESRISTLLTKHRRGDKWLKQHLLETNERNNILVAKTTELENVQKQNASLLNTVKRAEKEIKALEERLQQADMARNEDTEALQLAEREVYTLSEKLRAAHAEIAKLGEWVAEEK